MNIVHKLKNAQLRTTANRGNRVNVAEIDHAQFDWCEIDGRHKSSTAPETLDVKYN